MGLFSEPLINVLASAILLGFGFLYGQYREEKKSGHPSLVCV